MHQIEAVELKRVKTIKALIHGLLEGFYKADLKFHILEFAIACEEVAAELRKQASEDFIASQTEEDS